MPSSRKILIIVSAVLLAAIIAMPLLFSRPNNQSNQAETAGSPNISSLSGAGHSPPANAFLPQNQNGGYGNRQPAAAGPVLNSAPQFQASIPAIPSVEDLQKIISAGAASSAAAAGGTGSAGPIRLLALPQVSDSELKIDPAGVSSTGNYLVYFAEHYADIVFDAKRFQSVLLDENKLPLMPQALVSRALDSGNFKEVHDSLQIFRDYIISKINFQKSIGVYGEAVDLNRKMIALDELTLDLIQKDFDVESGKLQSADLKAYSGQYYATVMDYSSRFVKESGVLSLLKTPDNFWTRLADLLGLDKVAIAQFMPSFGGMLGPPIFCVCNFGFWAAVGPPQPPASGSLFIPISFIASPLFFIFRSLRPGAWWLGLYSPAVVPCMEYFGVSCFPIGFGNLVIMAGTSI